MINAIGILRTLRAAMTSRLAIPQSRNGKLKSIAPTTMEGKLPDSTMASRPASHANTSQPSKGPWTGGRPVQVATAVSMKPAMAAPAKPTIIS